MELCPDVLSDNIAHLTMSEITSEIRDAFEVLYKNVIDISETEHDAHQFFKFACTHALEINRQLLSNSPVSFEYDQKVDISNDLCFVLNYLFQEIACILKAAFVIKVFDVQLQDDKYILHFKRSVRT